MANILPPVEFATITGRFMVAGNDSDDPGAEADIVPAKGKGSITPSVGHVLVSGSTPPATVKLATVDFEIDSEGYISDAKTKGRNVQVIAPSEAVNPSAFTYRINFDGGLFPGFDFYVVPGSTIDLTAVGRVATSVGVATTRGETGVGVASMTLSPDQASLVVAYDNGTEQAVEIPALGEIAQQAQATTDEVIAAALADPDSATRAAGNATYASVAQINNRPVNVRDFPGVDPTGQTECGAAVRTALLASDKVEMGRGGDTFLIGKDGTNSWAMPVHPGQIIDGNGATVRLAPDTPVHVATLQPQGDGWKVRDLKVDGNREQQSAETNLQRHGVMLKHVRGGVLEGVDIYGAAGDAMAFYLDVYDITCNRVTMHDTDRAGVALSGYGADILFNDCHAWDVMTQGFDVEIDTEGAGYDRVTSRDCSWGHGPNEFAVGMTGLFGNIAKRFSFIDTKILGGVTGASFEDLLFFGGFIDARGSSHAPMSTNYHQDGITLRGLKIYHDGTAPFAVSLLAPPGGSDVADRAVVEDLEFHTGTSGALQISGYRNLTLRNCQAYGTPIGSVVNELDMAYSAFEVAALSANTPIDNATIEGVESRGYRRNVYVNAQHRIAALTASRNRLHGLLPSELAVAELHAVELVGAVTNYERVTASDNSTSSISPYSSGLTYPDGLWVRRSGGGRRPVFEGTGSPEGVVAAPIGSMAIRIDGGTATTLYVKESGTGNAGWVAK